MGNCLRAGALVLCVAALGGCSTLVPSTVARLVAMDPLTADPAGIEVALILPAEMRVAPDGAKLEVSARHGKDVETGRYRLAEKPGVIAGMAASEGARVSVFRIAPEDLPRMRAAQAKMAGWKALTPRETSGSFGVGLEGCKLGAGPEPDARVSVLIRTQSDAEFAPLIRNAQLGDLLGPEVFAAIKPCEGAQ